MKRMALCFLMVGLLCGCGLRSEDVKQEKQTSEKTLQSEAAKNFAPIAAALIKQGKVVEAVKLLEQVVSQDPSNVQAYMLLGQIYMHLNEFDLSVDSYNAALAVAPDQGEIYYMLAIVNGLRGRKDLAVSNAEKALLLFQQEKDADKFKRALVLLQGLSQE